MRLIGERRSAARGRSDARRLLAALGLLLAAAVTTAGPAFAHDELRAATPRAGVTVDRLPGEIRLAFDRTVLPDLSVVRVTGPGGEAMSTGTATVAGTVVTQRTAGLAPAGAYRLAYRVVSADGHPVTGGWTFTVRRAGPVGGPDAGGSDPRPARGGPGGLGLLGLGALAVALAGALAVRARLVRRAAAPDHPSGPDDPSGPGDAVGLARPVADDRLPVGR